MRERYKLGTSYHKNTRLTNPFTAGGWAVLNRSDAYYVHRFTPWQTISQRIDTRHVYKTFATTASITQRHVPNRKRSQKPRYCLPPNRNVDQMLHQSICEATPLQPSQIARLWLRSSGAARSMVGETLFPV